MTGFIKSKPSEAQIEREEQKALRTLSLERGATKPQIREQFKLLVHANHPDGQQAPDYGGVLTMEKLIQAKNFLIKQEKENG